MNEHDIAAMLRDHGIPPTAQRLAVAEYVLDTDQHPSADDVLLRARERLPMLSRATVYNTLHLLVEKGLLQELTLAVGRIVYDCNVGRHHHFIDEETGVIHDVPWDAVRVSRMDEIAGYDVREYSVTMRGSKKRGRGHKS